MLRALVVGSMLGLGATIVACGSTARPGGGGGGGPDGGRGGGSGGGGGGGGSGSDNGCSASAKLVYLVDQNNTFYSDIPPAQPVSLGTLNCPDNTGATPFSMGVDRNTIGWVLYSDGSLFHVDINNGLKCTATSFNMSMGMGNFGMGFSTNSVGGTDDTLFIAGGAVGATPSGTTSATFDSLNTGTMAATKVGKVSGWPELTGNANAELWGWFPDPNTPKIEKIDKTTGNALTTFQSSLSSLAGMPAAWAFAFYGGDYFVYLATSDGLGGANPTTIYQVDGMTGAVKGHTDTTTTIVGAGVSTCAPTVIN
jgi:hypothetical protein